MDRGPINPIYIKITRTCSWKKTEYDSYQDDPFFQGDKLSLVALALLYYYSILKIQVRGVRKCRLQMMCVFTNEGEPSIYS
jgi:hypothetical protein